MQTIQLRLLGGVQLVAPEPGGERVIPLPPKPLALLAYLAVAGADGRPIRRDTLLALFWPELPNARARAALRQVLFRLRRAMGGEALRTDRENVALSGDALSCDVVAFSQALAAGDPAAAMELHGGDLLDGFFVDGMSAELEAWIERQRARLRRDAYRACWALADAAEGRGDVASAGHWARRAVALEPDDETAVRHLIQLLYRLGDAAGALHTADEFAHRMAQHFGVAPSAETQALVAALRVRSGTEGGGGAGRAVTAPAMGPPVPATGPPLPATDPPVPAERNATGRGWGRAGRWLPPLRSSWIAAAAILAVLVGGELFAARGGRRTAQATTGPDREGSPAVTIRSPVARRLYQEGLGRFYAGDGREGLRLLRAALAEDSACAMCAYYASVAAVAFGDTLSLHMARLAVRLSTGVSEPERLLIHYAWASATNSPNRLAIAESLATRYPNWPQAQLAMGEALTVAGDYLAAAVHLRRVIAEDTGRSASSRNCPACSAQLLLIRAYKAADSLPAALRVAQVWVRGSRHSRPAWLMLAHTLAESGRYDEARAALDSSTWYAAGVSDDAIERAQIEIRAGNFPVADRLLRTLAQTGVASSKEDALWWLVISLRQQGRFREALALARGPLRSVEIASRGAPGNSRAAEGQALFELGRYRQAATIFAAMADAVSASPTTRGSIARQRAWYLTQAGSAVAAAGDTAALVALADTVEAWGRKSGFGRDAHLHEYLRGLLWLARRQPDEAVVAFRQAMLSETQTFSRIDFQLARALVALHRPAEAVPVLRHSLGGSIEGGNFYATRTEMQELLARAYDAAGQADSAATYYGYVLRAWRMADPQLRTRVALARTRLVVEQRRLGRPAASASGGQ